MAKASTFFRPKAARDAAIKAGIPRDLIVLVKNERGRYAYQALPAASEPPPLPPPAPVAARRSPVRALKARPAEKVADAGDPYEPVRVLVVLNRNLLDRIEVAKRRVKPGARVPNRSEIIRRDLDRTLPPADARR